MKLLTIFIFVVLIHAIYNLINFLRYNYVEQLLIGNYTDDAKLRIKAKTHVNTILNYIKYSGISDRKIPVSQALGYGQIATGCISIFENLLNNRSDVAIHVSNLLLEAKGNYWSRFINSFNPFYWIRIVLYIPKYLLSYLGVKADSIIIKVFQLIYWLIGIICTFAFAIFPEEIKAFIMSFI